MIRMRRFPPFGKRFFRRARKLIGSCHFAHFWRMVMGIAIGLAVAEAGYQQANPGERMMSGEEVLKAIAPYLEPARSRSDQGPQSSTGPPGAMGFNGVSSLGLGLFGGPDLYMDLPPEPGCPCGDGLPGGGHLGANLSTGVGFGFGGLGGFGGF